MHNNARHFYKFYYSKTCKRKCLRRKDPEVGLIPHSSADPVADAPKTGACTVIKIPDSTHVDAHPARSLSDTSTSTPWMVASTVADTLNSESTVTDIPDSTHVNATTTVAETSKTEGSTVIDIPDSTHADTLPARIFANTPTSTPLTEASTIASTNNTEACTGFDIPDLVHADALTTATETPKTESFTAIDIPDSNSSDTSFTCSSLSDEFPETSGILQSSPSLTSVSSLDLTSEVDTSFLAQESDILSQCSSSTSTCAMPIKPEKELAAESPVSPTFEPNVGTDAPVSAPSFLLTIEPDVSTSYFPSAKPATSSLRGAIIAATVSTTLVGPTPWKETPPGSPPSSHPATPKQSSSLNLTSSASDESTRTMTAESGASSRETCKTPVAPKDEVVITIEDDEDEVVIYTREKSETGRSVINMSGVTNEDDDSVTRPAIDVSDMTTENLDDVTKSRENAAVNGPGVTVEVKDSLATTVDKAIDDISGATSDDKDGVTVINNAVTEIFGVTGLKDHGVRLIENSEVVIAGVTREVEDNATVSESAVVDLSGVVSEEGDRVMVVEHAVIETSDVTTQPNLMRSEEHVHGDVSAVKHKKNTQVGCLCHYCEKHRQKSSGFRFFKLPR